MTCLHVTLLCHLFCLKGPLDIGSTTRIEFFSPDEETAYDLVVKELTFDPASIDLAKMQGKTLTDIDQNVWNYIWETKETFSQDTNVGTQSTEGRSHQLDKGLPQYKRHDRRSREIEENSQDNFPPFRNETKTKSKNVVDINVQYHAGENDNGDGECEYDNDAETLGSDTSEDGDEERSVYDDDPIVWKLPNGDDANYDIMVVDEAIDALRSVEKTWSETPIDDRDRSFYKTQEEIIVDSTKALLQLEQMPRVVFEEWYKLAMFFISSK